MHSNAFYSFECIQSYAFILFENAFEATSSNFRELIRFCFSVRTLSFPADVPQTQKEDMLICKLKACEKIFDFSATNADLVGQEAKRRELIDIADYISSTKGVFTESLVGPFMSMVRANILRALPVGSSTDRHYDAEEDDPHLEPAWAHLQVVYELLRKFVTMSDVELTRARSHITTRFVEGLVELFNSEDPREREYLKMILHRIYGKVMPLRGPIRNAIMNSFFRVVHERTHHHGISELLEILGSIINGFSVPLKEEHKALLRRGLMPLHTAHTMPTFHTQLSFCVTQFVQKEPRMAGEVVRELTRHWPVTHTRKEVMFLNELEELLDLARPADADGVVDALFKRLARCMESQHFQVAERVLYFWNNEYVVNLFVLYRARLMPLVVGALHENVEQHWNPSVQALSFQVQKLLREMDPELYTDSMRRYNTVERKRKQETSDRLRRWRTIDSIAERRRRRRPDNGVDDDDTVDGPAVGDTVAAPYEPTPHSDSSGEDVPMPQADVPAGDALAPRPGMTGRSARSQPLQDAKTNAPANATGGVPKSAPRDPGDAERAGRNAVFVRCGDASVDGTEEVGVGHAGATEGAVGMNLSV